MDLKTDSELRELEELEALEAAGLSEDGPPGGGVLRFRLVALAMIVGALFMLVLAAFGGEFVPALGQPMIRTVLGLVGLSELVMGIGLSVWIGLKAG